MRRWVDLRANLDHVEKREMSRTCWELNLDHPARSLSLYLQSYRSLRYTLYEDAELCFYRFWICTNRKVAGSIPDEANF
jgi:hypothetical protein